MNTIQHTEGGSSLAPGLTDKRGFAARYGRKARTVQHWLALGMPHLRLGHRTVVIRVDEGDAWVASRFRTQRFAHKPSRPQRHKSTREAA